MQPAAKVQSRTDFAQVKSDVTNSIQPPEQFQSKDLLIRPDWLKQSKCNCRSFASLRMTAFM